MEQRKAGFIILNEVRKKIQEKTSELIPKEGVEKVAKVKKKLQPEGSFVKNRILQGIASSWTQDQHKHVTVRKSTAHKVHKRIP
jgi:phosphosulfolactate synthase (CoM biosynthesis protein A)